MFATLSPSVQRCIVLVLSIVVVAVIVVVGRTPGVGGMQWAYEIGSQPFYRLLFLLVVLVVASSTEYFPVALMLVLLYLVINSMVPMLTNLPESFVFGPPATECDAYNQASVKAVGTPFYPLNNENNGGNRAFDKQQVPGGDGYDATVAAN